MLVCVCILFTGGVQGYFWKVAVGVGMNVVAWLFHGVLFAVVDILCRRGVGLLHAGRVGWVELLYAGWVGLLQDGCRTVAYVLDVP